MVAKEHGSGEAETVMKPLQRPALPGASGLFMSTAAAERDFSFRTGRALPHWEGFGTSFMFSRATPNLSFWVLLTTETPQKGKKAWQGKAELLLACTDPKNTGAHVW